MRTLSRLITSSLVALSLVASVPVNAHAGWEALVKPDIKVAKVLPSTVSSKHVRVILTNTSTILGGAATGGFYVFVKVHGSTPSYGYQWVGSIAANSGLGIDVYVGTNIMGKPGLLTEVRADVFNSVKESVETNNTGYYVSPPW